MSEDTSSDFCENSAALSSKTVLSPINVRSGNVSGLNGIVPRGGIVTARGTGDGLVIRLDGRVEITSLRSALYDFVLSRKSFLTGNSLSFEWVGQEPAHEVVADFSKMLAENFDVVVASSYLQNSFFRKAERPDVQALNVNAREDDLSLFGGVKNFDPICDSSVNVGAIKAGVEALDEIKQSERVPATAWDDPDARVVYATLRSGQRVETEHSLIVIGDVNSGAELIAGGDIIVLGILRGVAHAGAYDETGGGRFIFALSMQPTQLRIGVVISRGTQDGGGKPEIARVDGSSIIVEAYHAKTALSKMRRF